MQGRIGEIFRRVGHAVPAGELPEDMRIIGQRPDLIGLKGSPTRVTKVFAPPVKTNRVRLEGTPAEQAEKLVGILAERHLV